MFTKPVHRISQWKAQASLLALQLQAQQISGSMSKRVCTKTPMTGSAVPKDTVPSKRRLICDSQTQVFTKAASLG